MRRAGALTILVAMLAYCLAAAFLEYYGPRVGPEEGSTYLHVATSSDPGAALQVLGGVLIVFGAPSLIAALAVAILAGRLGPGPAVAGVAVWATFILGTSPRLIPGGTGWDVGVGFWVGLAAAVVALLGAIVLLVGRDRPVPAPPSTGD